VTLQTPDTPDWQVGVVTAQQGQWPIPSGTDAEVNIAANTETMVIVAMVADPAALPTIVGNQTGYTYSPQVLSYAVSGGYMVWLYVDVSSILEIDIKVTWGTATIGDWGYFLDNATHIEFDPNIAAAWALIGMDIPTAGIGAIINAHGEAGLILASGDGTPYTIPVAPQLDSGDHPPTEILMATLVATAVNADVLPAPGAGMRYRIFGVKMWLETNTTGVEAIVVGTNADGTVYFTYTICDTISVLVDTTMLPLSGTAMSANTPIQLGFLAGSEPVSVSVWYTQENV
jgi:hypothetical protein